MNQEKWIKEFDKLPEIIYLDKIRVKGIKDFLKAQLKEQRQEIRRKDMSLCFDDMRDALKEQREELKETIGLMYQIANTKTEEMGTDKATKEIARATGFNQALDQVLKIIDK